MTKQDLRVFFRSKVADLPSFEKRKLSKKAVLSLMNQVEPLNLIGSYSALKSEVDLKDLNEFLASQNKLALPRVEEKKLRYYFVQDLEKDLVLSSQKILEPRPDRCPPAPLKEIALILVPGLAFDRDGYRLGYGKGYYDRFLSENPFLKTLGVAFNLQKSQSALPREAHDKAIDRVVYF